MGRSVTYEFTDEVAQTICDAILEGKSLREIAKLDGMPTPGNICRWLTIYPDFAEQYARAKEEQAELLADEIMAIADASEGDYTDEGKINPEAIARSRLRVDARKWVAAKLKPKKYGERMELAGDANAPLTVQVVKFGQDGEG